MSSKFLAAALLVFTALVLARGGGGCFLPGTMVQTTHGSVPIENLILGEQITSFENNSIVSSELINIYQVERDYFYVIRTTNKVVSATAEHPFYTAAGYVTTETLLPGDYLFILENNSLIEEPILSISRVNQKTKAYNLQVSDPHTFFADSFAVHNKGCFLAGTKVLSNNGLVAIEKIQAGNMVYSFDKEGNIVTSEVTNTYSVTRDHYYVLKTGVAEVSATPEHPFFTSDGYKTTEELSIGEDLFVYSDGKLVKEPIISIQRVDSIVKAYNLEVDNTHTFFANGFAVHNKGGCFTGDTEISCQDGPKNISDISPGDTVFSFFHGSIVPSTVSDVYALNVSEFYDIQTENSEVKVTAEHPFYTGHTFVEAQNLNVGDEIYLLKNNSLYPEKITSKTFIQEPTTVYNLRVSGPHNFFADSFAVHNKGCFLAGTKVLSSNGQFNIEDIQIGDTIYSFNENNEVVTAEVTNTYSVTRDHYYILETNTKEVSATPEHPFYTSEGYKTTEELSIGEDLFVYSDGKLVKEPIISIQRIDSIVKAYNLEVDNTHTFFANDFAVHNKGGSGRSSSHKSTPPDNIFYYNCSNTANESGRIYQCCRMASSTRMTITQNLSSTLSNARFPYCKCTTSSCTCVDKQEFLDKQEKCPLTPIEAIFSLLFLPFMCLPILAPIIFVVFVLHLATSMKRSQWSSTIAVPKSQIYAKAQKVSALLELWGKVDQLWQEQRIHDDVKTIFLKLQECWQKREYAEMQDKMIPALYAQHVAQLDAMRRIHEINKLENLSLLDVKLVLVKNHHNKTKDEFTAWVQASAMDYIIDDRSGKKVRGDTGIGTFEEFWVFQRDGELWKLRRIDQPEEGMNVVKTENFDSISTAKMVERKYEKTKGPAIKDLGTASTREQTGATVSAGMDQIKSKAGKVHSLLLFLADHDKAWDEEKLKDYVRTFFITFNTALMAKDLSTLKPQMIDSGYLVQEKFVQSLISSRQRIEKRNLAVRNVEIVLVKNYYDNKKDEFTAWVSGQAQTVTVNETNNSIVSGDSYVADFEEFWTFQRDGEVWKLRDIEKGLAAKDYVTMQNLDEGSNPDLMDWYYKQDRAVI